MAASHVLLAFKTATPLCFILSLAGGANYFQKAPLKVTQEVIFKHTGHA